VARETKHFRFISFGLTWLKANSKLFCDMAKSATSCVFVWPLALSFKTLESTLTWSEQTMILHFIPKLRQTDGRVNIEEVLI